MFHYSVHKSAPLVTVQISPTHMLYTFIKSLYCYPRIYAYFFQVAASLQIFWLKQCMNFSSPYHTIILVKLKWLY